MKVGRNDSCPCGSGKKYKKCCLDKNEAAERAKTQAATQAAEQARRAEEEARRAQQEQSAREWNEQRKNDPLFQESFPPEAEIPAHPPLSADDQRLVDAWWEEVGPVYMSEDITQECGWLLQRALDFLDQQPRLFRDLDLCEEFLFLLGDALESAGRRGDYLALLQRLRRDQPDLYLENFGEFDYELVVEAIQTGRLEDIPAFLALFKEYPAKMIDHFSRTVDLLAWRGFEKELRELLEPTAQTIFDSPDVFGGEFGLIWLTHLTLFPFLEAGEDSAETLDKMYEAVLAVGYIEKDRGSNHEWLGRQLRLGSRSPTEAGLDLKKPTGKWFHHDVAWSFTGWAHREKGLAWTSARFLADSLLNFWESKAEKKKKGASHFRLNKEQLEEHLVSLGHGISWAVGVSSLATLQAFHYFTEYLLAYGYCSAPDAALLQAACAEFFERIRKQLGTHNAAYRLCPTYDALIAGLVAQSATPE